MRTLLLYYFFLSFDDPTHFTCFSGRGRGRGGGGIGRDRELIGQTIKITQVTITLDLWRLHKDHCFYFPLHAGPIQVPHRYRQGRNRDDRPCGAALQVPDHLCGPLPHRHRGRALARIHVNLHTHPELRRLRDADVRVEHPWTQLCRRPHAHVWLPDAHVRRWVEDAALREHDALPRGRRWVQV